MAYQPLYQAPPKWRAVLAKTSAVAAARWAAFCVWWMYRPAAEVDDLRWYAAEQESSNDSSEGQQAAAVQQVGRHRTPEQQPAADPWQEQPLTEQQKDEHRGATADWSPTGELRQIMAGELSPVETLRSVVISTEIRVPETAALAADVHQALDGWDDLFKPGLKRIDAVIAGGLERQYPKQYIAERAREATQSWPIVVPRSAELVAA